MERVSISDVKALARQLGREPRGRIAVARRCGYGYPQLLRVHPVVDGKPFPTLYWLTCPFLREAIDRLEADGWIRRVEDRLAQDRTFAGQLDEARRSYVEERLALLSKGESEDLSSRGMLAALSERGIGGIAEPRGVKCLHLHAAHELASANPIGALVVGLVARLECAPKKVICSTLERVEQIDQINR